MTTTNDDPVLDLSGAVKGSWHRFLDLYEPLRPELYRYCRHLTRSPWDADDLAQDTLARAFVTLGTIEGGAPTSPRAWLFRIASNLWIDRVRRQRELASEADAASTTHDPRAQREAAGTLLSQLSPQERAAVVLKDVFDLTLEEIAEALSTTVGAVKAALHGGRSRLADPTLHERARPLPPREVIDAFVDAFNAHDLDRVAALLMERSTVEVDHVCTQYGRAAAREGVLTGMMFGSRRLAAADVEGGIDPRFIQGARPTPPRVEARAHRGEWLLVHWYDHDDGEAVRAFTRLELDGDRIARVRNYFYTPEVLEEIARELDVPFRLNGHRYW
ncbi:RNA polymerase sigma factor [Sandaracinus amylolyticus]|uniref:RNA polymerase sigma factor n=1 Tax=Sandaracinus amylolyticus TaxID=927083 RepID=UPI001F2A5B35|nr:RNA polymerase sigma factor [Sandaracinus amylolyticus]UJR81353.1 RNA polymerase sigma factor [Sandaracinus amylolyticus]